MFLTRRRRAAAERVFDVLLNVNQLDSIPVVNSVMFVRWDVVNDKLADPATGRTWSQPVLPGNVVRWNEDFNFTVRIPSIPEDAAQLAPFVLRLYIRSERRKKSGFDELGIVEIDLADVAGIGQVTRSCLLHKSQLNSLLKVYIKVQLKQGDIIFHRSSNNKKKEKEAAAAHVPPDSSMSSLTSTVTPQSSSVGTETSSGTGESVGSIPAPSVSPSNSYSNNLEYAARVSSHSHHALHSGPGTSGQGHTLHHVTQSAGASSQQLAAPPRQSVDSGMDRLVRQKTSGPQSLPQWRQTTRDDSTLRPDASASVPHTPRRAHSNMNAKKYNGTAGQPSPLSPRSPRVNAVEVLDFLVPEPEQDDVYELMRLLRIRPEVPNHVLASRVPVDMAIDMLLEDAQLWQDSGKSATATGDGARDIKALDLERLIETSRMGNVIGTIAPRSAPASNMSTSESLNLDESSMRLSS